MDTVIYADAFDGSQQAAVRLPNDEYLKFQKALLAALQPKDASGQRRTLTSQDLTNFSRQFAYRQFENINRTDLYRHPQVFDLCCMVSLAPAQMRIVPGNNVVRISENAFQWTFFRRGTVGHSNPALRDDKVMVLNGGVGSAKFLAPQWVKKDDADSFFTQKMAQAGITPEALKLKRGGTKIPHITPAAYGMA